MREATAKDNAMTDPKEAAREAIIQAALAVRDADNGRSFDALNQADTDLSRACDAYRALLTPPRCEPPEEWRGLKWHWLCGGGSYLWPVRWSDGLWWLADCRMEPAQAHDKGWTYHSPLIPREYWTDEKIAVLAISVNGYRSKDGRHVFKTRDLSTFVDALFGVKK